MPAFIKTPKDEAKWNAIKHSVAKQRSKKIEDFTDRDWATVNAAWHKSEGNEEEFQKSLTSIKMPSATKMPRAKSLAKPGDKMSLFVKAEEIKQSSIEKLRSFLENSRAKNKR